MKPPEEVRRIAAEWLRKAEADLRLAEHLIEQGEAYLNAVAFHSQQAAEKIPKRLSDLESKGIPQNTRS